MVNKMERELYIHEIGNIHGLECWAVVAGEGTGSHVELCFGGKTARLKPLTNPFLSDAAKKYDSEYSLFIEECAWRIESEKDVICGSMSENSNDGLMVNGLENILNQKVSVVVVSNPALDLKIEFGNGSRLTIFCNTFGDDEDNYTFFSPQNVFTVKGYGRLDTEACDT